MNSKQKTLLKLILRCVTTVVIFVVMFTVVLKLHYYNDNNMFPVLSRGSLLISYKLDDPLRNDIVLYKNDGTIVAGRIVALEGDEVDISENGELLINGVPVNETVFYPTVLPDGEGISYPHKVEKDSYFILNDYRLSTNDSRMIGDVHKTDTEGAVVFFLGMIA